MKRVVELGVARRVSDDEIVVTCVTEEGELRLSLTPSRAASLIERLARALVKGRSETA